MVLSRLDPSISYIEEAAVDPGDVSHDASMYAVDVDGIPLIIALGKQKNTHINKNVVYFPMYLVEEPDQIDTPQIGLFEVRYSGLPNMLDDDGDIDLERSGPPLLYGFVDKAFLSKASNETSRKIIDEVGRTGRDANEDIDEDTDADEDTDEDTESEDTESEDTESEEAGGEEAGVTRAERRTNPRWRTFLVLKATSRARLSMRRPQRAPKPLRKSLRTIGASRGYSAS